MIRPAGDQPQVSLSAAWAFAALNDGEIKNEIEWPDLNIMCSRVALLRGNSSCSAADRQASLISDIFCLKISAF
jgi:hypothetical protein